MSSDYPVFDISPEAVAKMALAEEIRLLHSKIDRLENYIELTVNREYELNQAGIWIKRKPRYVEESEQDLDLFLQRVSYLKKKKKRV